MVSSSTLHCSVPNAIALYQHPRQPFPHRARISHASPHPSSTLVLFAFTHTYFPRGGMFPGCCHFYAIFYFGFSEISTAILCLLANFDPKYGIAGLDEAFPKTKLILGGLFVLSFIVCRLILWPYATYFFARDARAAMKSKDPRVVGRVGYLRIIYCCCVFLTLIQLLFVAMIVQTGKEEIGKFFG